MSATGYLKHYLETFDPLVADPTVIEFVVNGDGRCFVERQGASRMVPVADCDIDPDRAMEIANAAAVRGETKITASSPLLSTSFMHDAAMLRMQAVASPASATGTVLSFRMFRPSVTRGEPKRFGFLRPDVTLSRDAERLAALRRLRSIAAQGAGHEDELLRAALDMQVNILVPGGTSTGKTELGRRLLWMIDDDTRLVTIEDSDELLPRQPNVVRLIADRDDASPRSADKLLQATLRLRPDRIVVGELRGSEATTFLEAINTGHGGSFTTIHAETARKAMDRLALMVMRQGSRLRYAEVMRYLRSTIDMVIQVGRDGNDRGIAEVYFPPLDDAEPDDD